MHRIIFIIPYIGKYPWYFPYFLHSCRYNPTVDFLIFTDNNHRGLNLPSNVWIINYSLEQFKVDAAKAPVLKKNSVSTNSMPNSSIQNTGIV